MDVLGSVACIILTLPITIPLGLYIRFISPGPIFFRQARIGYQWKKFTMLKFRTMKPNADTSKHREHLARLIRAEVGGDADEIQKAMVKLEDDPQIIPGGRWIRALCLDELPQLINVLRGEMSLIGPRPAIPYEAEEYEPWHRLRFDVVPGMTGLWQVSGKNNLSFSEMVRLDIRYGRSLSFARESRILLRTFPTIFEQVRESRRNHTSEVEVLSENG